MPNESASVNPVEAGGGLVTSGQVKPGCTTLGLKIGASPFREDVEEDDDLVSRRAILLMALRGDCGGVIIATGVALVGVRDRCMAGFNFVGVSITLSGESKLECGGGGREAPPPYGIGVG